MLVVSVYVSLRVPLREPIVESLLSCCSWCSSSGVYPIDWLLAARCVSTADRVFFIQVCGGAATHTGNAVEWPGCLRLIPILGVLRRRVVILPCRSVVRGSTTTTATVCQVVDNCLEDVMWSLKISSKSRDWKSTDWIKGGRAFNSSANALSFYMY